MGRLRKNIDLENRLFADKKYFILNPFEYKENWKNVFKNNNPIHIEIGTGKGRFILEMAKNNPNINFIAIDKFPTILSKLLIKLENEEQPINNIKLASFDVKNILEIFSKQEVDKIYLNFPDPWPKKHHEKFRLTSVEFLNKFFVILKKEGLIQFKTDNDGLYKYTLNTLKENGFKIYYAINDLYSTNLSLSNIQTEYEIKWLSKNTKIKTILFSNKII